MEKFKKNSYKENVYKKFNFFFNLVKIYFIFLLSLFSTLFRLGKKMFNCLIFLFPIIFFTFLVLNFFNITQYNYFFFNNDKKFLIFNII